MTDEHIITLKKNIIAIGRLLWEKELVSGLNGNISVRIDNEGILLTATLTCLGLLQEKDILRMRLDGEVLDEGEVSKERLLHMAIYQNFPQVQAVIHTHTTFTNAYFLEQDKLIPQIFESRFYLGEVTAVEQSTPSVTNCQPVVEALRSNNIMVLKNHGVVAVGTDLFDCFLLIQCLEDAVKTDAISRLYRRSELRERREKSQSPNQQPESISKEATVCKYKLFSKEQMDEIVRLVNTDAQMKDLGTKTQMNMDLAVKLNETGQIYSFRFEEGRIAGMGNDGNAEFLISAPENIWRAVFNREIDPFVATTQKKMHLRGDFAKISKWYAPCSRIFEVWANVPVE
jgi:L-fuculose-phosphate aldolase